MANISDAPWIGHCEEEYEEIYFHFYDEDRENYEIEQAERELKEEQGDD